MHINLILVRENSLSLGALFGVAPIQKIKTENTRAQIKIVASILNVRFS